VAKQENDSNGSNKTSATTSGERMHVLQHKQDKRHHTINHVQHMKLIMCNTYEVEHVQHKKLSMFNTQIFTNRAAARRQRSKNK